MGWAAYTNGVLLAAAEGAAFEVFLTVDRSLQYQQNLSGRQMSILVLVARSNRREDLAPLAPQVEETLTHARPGELLLVESPAASDTEER